jgi:hypothetical protein
MDPEPKNVKFEEIAVMNLEVVWSHARGIRKRNGKIAAFNPRYNIKELSGRIP